MRGLFLIIALLALAPMASCIGRPQFKPYLFREESKPYFVEQFVRGGEHAWTSSRVLKAVVVAGEEAEQLLLSPKDKASWRFDEAVTYPGLRGDRGLLLASASYPYAISAPLAAPIIFDGEEDFIFQYEVKMQDGLECGGAYFKLFRAPDGGEGSEPRSTFDSGNVDKSSPYSIMFGPDRCGTTDRIHLIFQHLNRTTGKVEERHLVNAPEIKKTQLTTLYGLILRRDGTFAIKTNGETVRSGSLSTDFNPPFSTPPTIDDPSARKPFDWVDDEFVIDKDAKRPDDWNEDIPEFIPDPHISKPSIWMEEEPLLIPDPAATKPKEWLDEEDGKWTAPLISTFTFSGLENPQCARGCGPWKQPRIANPAHQGEWRAPLVKNPAYKGKWSAPQIVNPDAYTEASPQTALFPIVALGIEVWTMQANIIFDNIILTRDEAQAKAFADATWAVKFPLEQAALQRELSDSFGADGVKDEHASILGRVRHSLHPFIRELLARSYTFLYGLAVNPLEAIRQDWLIAANLLLLTLLIMATVSLGVSLIVDHTIGVACVRAPQADRKEVSNDDVSALSGHTSKAVEGGDAEQKIAKSAPLSPSEAFSFSSVGDEF